ncbi:MAG TPA: autotransporter outer membrane beta-barrel domain-containing protein, partial [Afifellaceae bacterium]|nr:autotransporter outer membrane beta-barrel domain-containing protein [Afifellaceae bacterium]
EFDAERWLASAALIGDFEVGAWNIRPEARVDYFEEKTEAYIDGLGGSIASVRASVGELTFGPTFTYTMRPAGGVAAATFIGVDGIWTFASENTATIASPGTIGLADTGLRARAEAGLSVNHDDGFSFSASAFYDGIGNDDFEAWGGKARISKQF